MEDTDGRGEAWQMQCWVFLLTGGEGGYPQMTQMFTDVFVVAAHLLMSVKSVDSCLNKSFAFT
jgi:hypothetical protein